MELQSIKQRFGIIGNAPKLNHAIAIAQKVAPTELSVLITGESGVGKESFSKIIHSLSLRKHEPFIAINCGAIPEGTIDSELFGHVKGSFTGALDNRKGYFEAADGGTIFLDEVGELPLGTQARLLRVLETGEFIRVGDSKEQKTDVRVVAATNVDLVEKVRQGKFREDLYFRLNTVPIVVPPLRERGTDIELLFRKFTTDFAEQYHTKPVQLTTDAKEVLMQYRWPGNVRQLKNVAEQVSVLSTDDVITSQELRRVLPMEEVGLLIPDNNQMDEREILYQMLFEMKNDLNNIKSFLYKNGYGDIFNEANNKVQSQVLPALPILGDDAVEDTSANFMYGDDTTNEEEERTYILPDDAQYDEDSFEESLSIADMEKELIQKALKKHNGTRKKAAMDLGISERTLYRKLKEYEIEG